ncbi:MAG: hypothetical protein R6U04_03945 [Bacteroidales bacterium]
MEAYADLHKVKDKISLFEKKYNLNFEKLIHSEKENFEKYDDYIEWKAYIAQLKDLQQKIKDIKRGKLQIS